MTKVQNSNCDSDSDNSNSDGSNIDSSNSDSSSSDGSKSDWSYIGSRFKDCMANIKRPTDYYKPILLISYATSQGMCNFLLVYCVIRAFFGQTFCANICKVKSKRCTWFFVLLTDYSA